MQMPFFDRNNKGYMGLERNRDIRDWKGIGICRIGKEMEYCFEN
jgi:hypothetical protein